MSRRKQARPNKVKEDEEQQELAKACTTLNPQTTNQSSVQDLGVLRQSLLTFQQQLLQLQLFQQLQREQHGASRGGESVAGGTAPGTGHGRGPDPTSSSDDSDSERVRNPCPVNKLNQSTTSPQNEDDADHRRRPETKDHHNPEDQQKHHQKPSSPKQVETLQSPTQNIPISTRNDGLSPHFATLLNCQSNQDPNRPLSPGLQGNDVEMGVLGNGFSTMENGCASGGLNSLNSLEMLQKRAEEVLDSASQGLLQSSLSADDLRKKSGDKNGREPFFKHRCRYCGKVFGSDSALQIHIRSHTGERPFKCNVCGSRFTTKGNLKVHFQRHTSKFPHIKMNPHPVPEHLDRFHPPLIADGGMSPELEESTTAAPAMGPLHLHPALASAQQHLPMPIPFNNFPTPHHYNQMWKLVGVAERIQQEGTKCSKVSGGNSVPEDLSRKVKSVEESGRKTCCASESEEEEELRKDLRKVTDEISTRKSPSSGESASEDKELIKQEPLDEFDSDVETECRRTACEGGDQDQVKKGQTPTKESKNNQSSKQNLRRSLRNHPSSRNYSSKSRSSSVTSRSLSPVDFKSRSPIQDDSDDDGNQPENLSSKTQPLMYPLPIKFNNNDQHHYKPQHQHYTTADPSLNPLIYSSLLPRPGSNDNAWESLIEVTRTSETTKLQQLVDNIEHKLTDPNQCIVCHRVLSCKSALQMHYRTHTGERPFKCKICSRAFTTKGNLKTHMGVHRAKPVARVLHQCPVCHKRFTNALVLQQHIRLHTGEPTDLTLEQIHAAEVREPFSPSTNFSNFHPPGLFLGMNPTLPTNSNHSPNNSSTSLAALENQVRTITTTFANSTGSGPVPSESTLSNRQQQLLKLIKATGQPIDQNKIEAMLSIDSDTAARLMNDEEDENGLDEEEMDDEEIDDGGSSPMSGISSSDWVFEHPGRIKSPIVNLPLDLTSDKQSVVQQEKSVVSGIAQQNEPTRTNSNKSSSESSSTSVVMKSGPSPIQSTPPPGLLLLPNNVVGPNLGPMLSNNIGPSNPAFLSFLHAGNHPFNNMLGPRQQPPSSDYTTMWNTLATRGGNTTCNICLKTFACNSALEIHYRSHTKERPFKCNVCDRGFSTKGNMKQHMLTHKMRDGTVCGGHDSSDESSRNGLKRSSSESSLAKCSLISKKVNCGEQVVVVETPVGFGGSSPKMSSSSPPGLLQDRAMESDSSSSSPKLDNHNNESSQCQQVNPTSSNSSTCTSPIAKPAVTTSPPISTNSSSSNNSVQQQQPSSNTQQDTTTPTKHLCEVCHKNFSSSSSVHIHMRTHTGDKPFKCSVCSKAFTTKGNLKVHMGTHMWTNGLSRRGRRMSLELTLPFAAAVGGPQPPSLQIPHHHQISRLPNTTVGSTIKHSSHHRATLVQQPAIHRQDFFLPFQASHPLLLTSTASSTTATTS